MDQMLIGLIQIFYAIGLLLLTSIGLAVAFGMMRIVNFAHGEFIMLGGFTMVFACQAGINFFVSMLVVTPLVTALLGMIVERIIIRPLYGRIIDTILATWGLSLLLIGLASTWIGYYQTGLTAPFGNIAIGGELVSTYTLFIIALAAATAAIVYGVLRFTSFGLLCRSVMQDVDMASAVGINTGRIYALTFGISTALAGLAGAAIAPLTGIVPTTGIAYATQAFITVISGGANAVIGTIVASSLFGAIYQIVSQYSSNILGQMAMLLSAIVILRLLPSGITGRFFKGSI
ncbi:branched-chain amino acid ABC transporter permease [Rhizobium puerariae]|uniref:Branched-chain amino acid ABC transporter permease n=1 Tax=Rhizobium puerariae TaxID=1585791 RepID=A0ABV6AJA5_9HYPH